MKEYKYNNATVRMYGNACHATLKEATIRLLKKVEIVRSKRKDESKNGNIDTCRIIEKE